VANRVGTKGQVVIEKAIRDELGVEPGWTAIQQLIDGHVEIYFIPPRHTRSLSGVLAPYTDVRIPDEEAFHEATDMGMGRAREGDRRANE
jgi:bifunctional DNA-binding transcriptional regulator/antitoxin component of YhaV-PrlF toxin-antitoxin module